MFNYFPTPYPGETMYGVLSRYMQKFEIPLSGLKEILREDRQGIIRINPVIGVELNNIVEQLPSIYPFDAQYFIDNHTIIPIYKAFLEEKEYKQLECNAIHNWAKISGTMSKNAAWEIRYCAKCIEKDRQIYGEAYLHREHQIKGVIFCSEHSQLLEAIPFSTSKIIDINKVDLYGSYKLGKGLANEQVKIALKVTETVNLVLNRHQEIGYRKNTIFKFIEKVYGEDEYIFNNKMNRRKIKECTIKKYYLGEGVQGTCEEFNQQAKRIIAKVYILLKILSRVLCL